MRTPQTIKEIDKVKILKIVLPRTVLGDCTNITLSKDNTTKQVGTKKFFTSKRNEIDSSTKNCGQSLHATRNKILPGQKNETTILNSRDLKNHHNMNVDGSNNGKKVSKNYHDELHEPEIRPSVPLTKRLRKGTVKNYLESTLESTTQCTPDKSKSKVPIYRQQIPILPKSKSSDPYALDIIDTNENKRKKKKRSSAKFNKTIYNVMEKIEKKERKVTRKKKFKKMSPSYEDKIKNVMNKVLRKVHENNLVANRSDSTPKLDTTVINNKSKMLKTHSDIEDGFQGFDNNDKSISSVHHLSLPNSSAMSIPSTSTFSNKQINIISNISIEQIQNSTITNTPNSSHMNTTCKDIDTNKMNTTSNVDPLEKSHNLHREFHNDISEDISLFNEHTLDVDCEFDLDDYVEDKEDDEFFGFQDENSEEETTVPRLYKKKIVPWRFQGYFRRIPHILKLKKNGLPCKQQEMVLDYEFVQRIEALCSKKSSNPKSPVQTTMLKYVESTHDEPIRPSLFDYEEFNIAKTPRRVLGVIQSNKVISTPTNKLQAVIMSPNVSIIASNENEENVLLKSPRKSYRKKCVQKKKNENEKVLDEGALPSILENNPEAPQDDDVHLFEDVDNEKETDFTITLPILKYDQKRRRKRQISEGSDDEKKSKKKKKNMMTKAEEIEFNAWADKMNTRFAEDDLHELTIE